MAFRISVDTGGTFTDVVVDDERGHLRIGKALTSRERAYDGIRQGLAQIAPELGLNAELPAEGNRMFVWQVPNTPGTYDVYCETCCGGKDSPTMHGKIVIEAA